MSQLRFHVDSEAAPLVYEMGYCASEYSLVALPRPCGSVGGVSLGQELHIEWEMLSDDMLALLNPEGLCYLRRAQRTKLRPPEAESGRVVAPIWPTFSTGGNYNIRPRSLEWRSVFDPASGWMCVGEKVAPPGARCVGISGSFRVVIHEFELIAAWVHVDVRVAPSSDGYVRSVRGRLASTLTRACARLGFRF